MTRRWRPRRRCPSRRAPREATGPPLRPQGSLPRSLRDGPAGPPLTRSLCGPSRAAARARALPAGPRGAQHPDQDQIPTNQVSTVHSKMNCAV